jgi:glycosyltransferase involved in cell wall biosynthesis
VRPRVLMVGRSRYRLPLSPSLRRKFDALEREVDLRVLGSAEAGSATSDDVFRLAPPASRLDGALFWLGLPRRIARELVRFRPDAVLAQSAYEAAAALAARSVVGSDVPVVVDVHGDWRTSTRLYGSPLRRTLGPLGDRVALSALRRSDAVRAVSPYTSGLVREAGLEPADVFSAFMDLEPFLEPPRPLPDRPQALFVGVLELYKNVDGLAEAWRLAAPHAAGATLRLVGDGTRKDVAEALVADLPEQTRWERRLTTDEVAKALDSSTALVLPSRSEGMGRVVVEALCRGRPVVGTRVGGIPDLVRDGLNGILVEPGDTRALAAALVRVLRDRDLAERLAAGARESVEPWLATPEDYASRVRAIVERVRPRLGPS